MDKYVKKPVVVEAVELYLYNFHSVADWCGGAVVGTAEYPQLQIRTLEGTMTAKCGDWIIKGVKGEFYPCKDGIFRATYDPLQKEEPK